MCLFLSLLYAAGVSDGFTGALDIAPQSVVVENSTNKNKISNDYSICLAHLCVDLSNVM